jgi:RNA 2',3'-cyclic 3'-phosphodiesterase
MQQPPRHRLFFAARPPVQLARQIEQLAHGLAVGRPLTHDRLHVTLGISIDYLDFPEPLAAIMTDAAEATAATGFTMTLDRIGASNRSIALRPSRANRAANALVDALAHGVAARRGVLRPDWQFSPHMTLLYHHGRPFTQLCPPIAWEVEEFVLIHSVVGLTQHHVLGRWALGSVAEPRQGVLALA